MTTVWIDEGCIGCGACPGVAPEVFALDASSDAVVRGEVRADARTDDNRAARAALTPSAAAAHAEAIDEAAAGCPVEVIRIERR